jgi:predicted membrane metal-binding protein
LACSQNRPQSGYTSVRISNQLHGIREDAHLIDYFSFGKAVDWLDRAFRNPKSDADTLAVMAVGFAMSFLIVRCVVLLIEAHRAHTAKEPLSWSGTMLALLFAASFWGTPVVMAIDILQGQTAPFYSLVFLFALSLLAPFIICPPGFIAVFTLLSYFMYSTIPRWVIVASVIITMIASAVFTLDFNHHLAAR